MSSSGSSPSPHPNIYLPLSYGSSNNGYSYNVRPSNIGFLNARSSDSNISARALKGRTPKNLSPEKKARLARRLAIYKETYNREYSKVKVKATANVTVTARSTRKQKKTYSKKPILHVHES